MLVGCSTPPSADEHRAQLQTKLRAVIVDDGISQEEADVIAENYYYRFTPLCGTVVPVTDGGTDWIAKTYYGIGAMPGAPIRIDKRTGRAAQSGSPTVENPIAIW